MQCARKVTAIFALQILYNLCCIKALTVIYIAQNLLMVELQLLPNDILSFPVLKQNNAQYKVRIWFLPNFLTDIILIHIMLVKQ